MDTLVEQIKEFPDTPGVYFFKRGRDILYIGKATSLKDRVRSYFSSDLLLTRGPLLVRMVEEADSIEYEQTDSVLEALVLEANLIKKHQPLYNTQEKDDKSYNYIVFTKEEFPRIFTLRGRELQTIYDPDDFKYVFGPYTSGPSLREALRIIRKIFPFRGEKDPLIKKKRISNLNVQLGIVPDFEKIEKKEYQKTINNLRLFFEGRKKQLIKNLTRDMKAYARAHEFEKANEIKRKIFALEHIQDVSLLNEETLLSKKGSDGMRIEAYDIAHTSGKEMVGVMVVIEDGFARKSEYRKFNIRSISSSNDTGALKEVLTRRLGHPEWPLPKLIVIDGGKAQLNAAQAVLDELGFQIELVSVVKDERHKPRDFLGKQETVISYEKEILLANSEAHRFAISFHRERRRKRMF